MVINIDESGLIRIEGSKEGIQRAKEELEEQVHKLENEKEKDLNIEQKHYRSIIGTKGENIKDIRDKFNQVQIIFPGPADRHDVVKIRGPKEDVDKCHKHLQKLVKDLNEASYQIDVPIYKQFHKFIIGKDFLFLVLSFIVLLRFYSGGIGGSAGFTPRSSSLEHFPL